MNGDRVFEAGDGRWFVHSNTVAGGWWKVELIPGESLTCSCPAGLRAGTALNVRPCRHIRAVVDRMEKAAAEVAEAVAS